MAIERRTIVDQLEYPRAGGTQVRLALMLVDGDKEISSKWHRTYIPADMPAGVQMAAVAEHLEQMGEAPLSMADVAKVYEFHAFVTR
jgi:hypothetical protein